jgi:hypothetical protein
LPQGKALCDCGILVIIHAAGVQSDAQPLFLSKDLRCSIVNSRSAGYDAAGRLCSVYEERGIFERLMDRLRRIAPRREGYAPVMVPALR